MAVEKAFLEVEGGARIPCLFNPSQLQISRSNSWAGAAVPGRDVPRLRYTGAESGVLRVDLFFDTTNDGTSVAAHTGKIVALMDIDPGLPGSDESSHNVRPPYVTFHWGDLHSFKAVVADLDLTFTYFSGTGTPLRATVGLTLRQYEPSQAFGRQNPTSGTPKPHRVHRVQSGETLDRIAARYYGDSTRWRTLAAANAIADPLALRPGTLLTVPRIDS
ncbi:MAG: LysM peptidoglycan-binding domain-containing protein [Cellulomonas sp.]|uniref:Peptidoglycan-binding protein n=2 Tax=Cellulomonas TaxID=1707 RepID=A0A4Y3KM80_9CELL|nr:MULTISPECIES: LysM peptidoglycan-binding domain-containing protein [Cellulomonas]KMM47179.1 peptidoglycan-binding protein [Cellulomonas sp. A375-1]MCR6649676.1 LysM peptidoglycan-binding domain-containing protein [Cellulomonas sp.]MCR6705650.1 LysM peptidoglycan-binding domain-containing protein [Cellulomonas sp.]GEA85087.1 peptidoglycan-binding protein [Cellulomonas gelida]GGL16196.1 peptidoglycan-binding protein [Cellulomonas gelida]